MEIPNLVTYYCYNISKFHLDQTNPYIPTIQDEKEGQNW